MLNRNDRKLQLVPYLEILCIEIFNLFITGFNVNSSTGIITSIKAFDYETENTPITINCTVDDTRNSGSVMVTVIIKDMNDNAPIYNSLLYKTYIKENTQTGVILRNVSLHSLFF